MLTRREARLIAEELHKIMQQQMVPEELLTTKDAAKYLNISASTLYHNKSIPYTKQGKKKLYTRSALYEYATRAQ